MVFRRFEQVTRCNVLKASMEKLGYIAAPAGVLELSAWYIDYHLEAYLVAANRSAMDFRDTCWLCQTGKIQASDN